MSLHCLEFRTNPVVQSIRRQPPHARAKNRYEEIVEQGHFVCTQEHPSEEKPEPIVIRVTENGWDKASVQVSNSRASESVPAALLSARGGDSPPTTEVGFGTS